MREPETVAVDELVAEAGRILEGSLEHRKVQVRVNGPLPYVHGDRQRLVEVFQNLLDNAVKFLGTQLDPQIEIGERGVAQNGLVTLYVRDNGIGIAPEFHERIFGLFNRLDPKVEGTGVGLALVKRIVEFHGGRIWVESKVGQGATFVFTLAEARGKQDESPAIA
jgi:signal transduction histidine kinase